jgi:hypothetical protein
MTDMADLADASALLEAERKRRARKPKTLAQRNQERLARRWWANITAVWSDARLLSDDELQWLAQVTDATRDRPARISRNGWNGARVVTRQPTSKEDAVRLENLRSVLLDREYEERHRLRCEGRQQVAERLARLGFDAGRYADMDSYALIDSYIAARGAS